MRSWDKQIESPLTVPKATFHPKKVMQRQDGIEKDSSTWRSFQRIKKVDSNKYFS